ncbi:MAG: Transposase, IS4 family protein [Parcubacteria bacterium 34_609]|nr:MAG: Transposase, IS4 family protein [Parcubacteria bacterium 34_609]KUK98835.1 MAG: Transposase, IS4 family protein [Parcubacteria bacterium 32_520]
MNRFKANQKLLFKAETVFNLRPLEKYEILFSFLDTSPLEILYTSTGRPPIPYKALLKALIYKDIKNISYLSDLTRELQDNPDLALVFGFHPLRLPYVENFSAFLGDTENSIFQEVRDSLVSKLIDLKEIKGTYLTFDSSNIPAKVKENNLKTSIKDRFTKTKRPKGDPESRLSIMVHFPKPFQKEFRYFWGYRNFVLSDVLSELPILEETRGANVVDSEVIIPQLELAKNRFNLNICAVIADAGLDSAKVLSFIINDLKAKPYIARNLRREKDLKVSPSGKRICLAGFEMLYWGKCKEGGRTRVKFVCPIIHSKKFRKEHPFCPWMHPQFVKGTGCFAYTQVLTEDIRKQIAYGTPKFKKVYNLRSGCERIFSRLLDLCMQNPSVRGLRAVSNHCTIAHITVLLIALTAAKTGNKDKIRLVKSFLPNI